MDDDGLAEQIAYYRARAEEYDEIYSFSPDEDALLDGLPIVGDVLEIACGTGRWTSLLARAAESVTAVDSSPEMIRIASTRVPSAAFLRADVFDWSPGRRFDTVFFGFFLSHVPRTRATAFWATVQAALRPGGRAVFVDVDVRERADEEEAAPDVVTRRLGDGRRFAVVKRFLVPADLERELADLGWASEVQARGDRFLAGWASPR